MRNDWFIPEVMDSNKIGTFNAVKHRITKELCLFGTHGEIWMYDRKTCYAVITSTRIAKQHSTEANSPVSKFDETLVKFPLTELEVWAKRLGIKRRRDAMLDIANGA